MKRTKLLAGLSLLAFLLSGCGEETAAVNAAPTITGVKDFQCCVNTTVDFLDGVAALDKEDGDITPDLEIVITPHIDVVDGFAKFENAGEYSVIYKIKDSNSRTTQKRSTVEVVDRDKYLDFVTPGGFYGETHGHAQLEKCGMVNNEFILKANGHVAAEDVMLSRKFNLQTNLQYTFKYKVDSMCAGKVVAKADGIECAEAMMTTGENELSFDHIILSEEDEYRDIEFSLCFGNIQGPIELKILGIKYEYPQDAGTNVDRTEDYSFFGRVFTRIEGSGRGTTKVNDDGTEATLILVEPAEELHLGGMFIDTGVAIKENTTYKVEFDVVAENTNYEIIVQRGRWRETYIDGFYPPINNGHHEKTFIPNLSQQGDLWLYVQTGLQTNVITIKNLKVYETLNPYGFETVTLEDYSEYHDDAHPCTLQTDSGGFTYTVSSFAEVDHDQQVTSPQFYVNGSSGNYVLTFKAKASKPVEMAVAAPVPGGWDPTLMYNRVNLTTDYVTYTFFFNTAAANTSYVLVWQFGFTSNQNYQEEVSIDVIEVALNYRNIEIDG